MTLHNTAYKHWDGHHLGIWRRRGVIASAGLKGSLQSKWLRYIVTVCWVGGLILVAWLFMVGQLLVPNSLIVRWASRVAGPWTLSPVDITNLPSIASRLKAKADPVSVYVYSQLSKTTLRVLAAYEIPRQSSLLEGLSQALESGTASVLNMLGGGKNARTPTGDDGSSANAATGEELRTYLAQDLNGIINRRTLYDPKRFSGVHLRAQTKQLVAQNPREDDMVRLNRLLLEDSFPGCLSKNLLTRIIDWLMEHPEISVHTAQNVLFFFFSKWMLNLSLIAIALLMPHLITRDISSNAITIYASKAVSRFDYVLGKFATAFGLLCLTWFGPLLLGWFLGNLLAPNWGFFWHSKAAMANTVLYAVSSMAILSVLALGVSATGTKEKTTVSLWIAFWLLGNAFIALAMQTGKSWLKFISFQYDLDQLSLAVFRLSNDLQVAQDNIPILGPMLQHLKRGPNSVWHDPEITGALCGLAIMLLLSAALVAKRVKPE